MKLYEALNPAHHHFGSTSNMLNSRAVVHHRLATNVLMNWVRSMSSSLDFYPGYLFLSLAMQTADFAFTFDKKEASGYMYRSNFVVTHCPRQFIRRDQGQNSLQELLMAYDLKGPSSLLMGVLFIR